jgi:superfamily II DNA or RNA helicase
MCKHTDKIGQIYYTNKLSKKITIEYNNNERIKLIKKEMIINENNNIFKLYDYQEKIINIANQYYINNNNNSGILSLPCGTGKTLISCYIGMKFKIVIMITPLKQYAQQNINRFLMYENNRKSLLIDSDGTRNINIINEFIKNNDNILLSATYKSCDIINQINLIDNNIIIIFDEFHNFSYNNIYNENDDINKLINNNNIIKLYMSATPRIYDLENNHDIDINEIFGDYIYKMTFNEAITNKYISDYQLYLPVFNNEELDNEIKELNILNDYLLKIQFLIEAIKSSGTLKMIVYMKCHEDIDIFINEFNKINNNYYYYDVWIDKITCNNSYSSRNKILDEFNKSTKISLLLNVYILDEAIDIPSCNSIYMTYISSSKIKNIQRMSRAMRYQNKKIAKIFLFCTEINECLDYISSIKEYDIDFNTKINYLSISNKYKNIKERIKFNNEKIENNKIKILGIKLYRSESWYDKLKNILMTIIKHHHLNLKIKMKKY